MGGKEWKRTRQPKIDIVYGRECGFVKFADGELRQIFLDGLNDRHFAGAKPKKFATTVSC